MSCFPQMTTSRPKHVYFSGSLIRGPIHLSTFRIVNIWPALSFTSRSVVRRAASLLNKVVDSLAPSITNVLVQGKQVSIFFPDTLWVTISKISEQGPEFET